MHELTLGDGRAKELIHDAFTGGRPVAPLHLMPVVSRLYFNDDEQRAKFPERSLWALNNAFTESVKALKASPEHQAGMKIGRFFGRVLRGGDGARLQLALPEGVEEGL
jgi:hypothetical protein